LESSHDRLKYLDFLKLRRKYDNDEGEESRWWRVEGGGWRVEGGEWKVEGGGWRVEGVPANNKRISVLRLLPIRWWSEVPLVEENGMPLPFSLLPLAYYPCHLPLPFTSSLPSATLPLVFTLSLFFNDQRCFRTLC
jgi:hypothetical protein